MSNKMKLKQVFHVDIPNSAAIENGGQWINMGTFSTLEEAQSFLQETFGIQEKDAHVFISPDAVEEEDLTDEG